MWLHAGNAVENCDGAIEHAQRTLNFGREINVTRRINDVDALLDAFENFVNAFFLALRPSAGRRRGRDRDPALAFLLHPIGDGGAFVHLAHLVDHAGVKQNALGDRRFAGIDVRGDSDVARPLERELAIRRIRIRGASDFFSIVAVAINFTSGNAQTRDWPAPSYECRRVS